MKVCTDACLFGAWVAKKLQGNKIKADDILDIGCGTGLLSLMIAQKSTGQIDAVEIDKNAFEQANENFDLSAWCERIHNHHCSVTDFQSLKKFDLIISNPPFYENQLKSENYDRNRAMHTTSLSYLELSIAIKKNLTTNGHAAVLLPYFSIQKFEEVLISQRLFVVEKLNAAHSPTHKFFRSMLLISNIENQPTQHSISIKDTDGGYSTEFKQLLKDYYLDM